VPRPHVRPAASPLGGTVRETARATFCGNQPGRRAWISSGVPQHPSDEDPGDGMSTGAAASSAAPAVAPTAMRVASASVSGAGRRDEEPKDESKSVRWSANGAMAMAMAMKWSPAPCNGPVPPRSPSAPKSVNEWRIRPRDTTSARGSGRTHRRENRRVTVGIER
jgi:hypothetical protein